MPFPRKLIPPFTLTNVLRTRSHLQLAVNLNLPQLQNISFPPLTTLQTTIETVFSNRDAIGKAWEAFLSF